MKNIANIIVAFLIGTVCLLCMVLIAARSGRKMELEQMLPTAVEEAVSTAFLKKQYTIADTKEFVADVRESIAQVVDSDGAITVDVLKIDREKGLCSIRVTADYVHPNGKAANVSCERTVIFDKGEAQGEKLCSISFYEGVDGARYKTVFVEEGAILSEPVPPYAEGKAFLGWTDAAGNAADFSMQVTQDMAYYAKWN